VERLQRHSRLTDAHLTSGTGSNEVCNEPNFETEQHPLIITAIMFRDGRICMQELRFEL